MVSQNHIDGSLGTYQYVSWKLFRWFPGKVGGSKESSSPDAVAFHPSCLLLKQNFAKQSQACLYRTFCPLMSVRIKQDAGEKPSNPHRQHLHIQQQECVQITPPSVNPRPAEEYRSACPASLCRSF